PRPRPRRRRRGRGLAPDAGGGGRSLRRSASIPLRARGSRPRVVRRRRRLDWRRECRAGGRAPVRADSRAPRAAVRRGRDRRGIVSGRGMGGDRAEVARPPRCARGAAMNFNLLWSGELADVLSRAGVREVVICPGSRSAPLALALAERLRAYTVVDERSAAFFALGAAKASGRRVALVCTWGSAGAHFYPALLEAEAAGVPLVAVTADRPPELHGFGAPQQLAQHRLFGRAAGFADRGP